MSGLPDPKARSLERGERRYRRKVASPKRWQAIIDAKGSTCRLAHGPETAHLRASVTYHHLVERDAPYFGDDVEDQHRASVLGRSRPRYDAPQARALPSRRGSHRC